jgi:hypothetical protein
VAFVSLVNKATEQAKYFFYKSIFGFPAVLHFSRSKILQLTGGPSVPVIVVGVSSNVSRQTARIVALDTVASFPQTNAGLCLQSGLARWLALCSGRRCFERLCGVVNGVEMVA